LPTPATRHERADTVLRLASGGGARLAMSGISMLPLLRAGMVLRLRAYDRRKPQIGDVVIFRQNDVLVAHRVVQTNFRGVRTSGDAQPLVVEDVAHHEILAVVDAVFASDADDARRIDDGFFRWRGQLFGHLHAPLALFARLRALAVAGAQFAFPWQRPRVQPALVAALGAIVRGDSAALAATIEHVPAQRFIDITTRHRCEGAILAALPAGDDRAESLRDLLAPLVRQDAVIAMLTRPHVLTLVKMLTAADVPFALLKGGARTFRSGGAQAHASCDIDVLVPKNQLEAAIAALRRGGYTFRSNDSLQLRYLRQHHHAAPLFPPSLGPSVELHTSLARPGTLGMQTDWDALAPHFERVESDGEAAYCFDAFATALHYAIHGIGFERMRDVFFCAQHLRDLSDDERLELRRLAESDSIDPVRFAASVALAARVAGLPWETDRRTERYLNWASRRADMPSALRERAWGVEAWFVAGCGTKFARRIMESDGPTATQLAGRMLLTPIALAYAAAMRAC
jgi:hypothetical protein